eukprot:GHRQ01030641.1.p1 GENE.GHRQ01030641.1~~GHRQ01030641.1.p1  ORF type:complete len:119 (+),score=19.26 GHRQ01030641.1:150-506(+)
MPCLHSATLRRHQQLHEYIPLLVDVYHWPQVFFDIKVEGENLGRIVVELVDDAAVGTQRFADLAQEKQGVGYRLSKIDGIFSVSGVGRRVFLKSRRQLVVTWRHVQVGRMHPKIQRSF